MVTKTLDGNSSPLDCLVNPLDCGFSGFCAQQEVWKSVDEGGQDLLSNIKLTDLAQRQRYLSEQVLVRRSLD